VVRWFAQFIEPVIKKAAGVARDGRSKPRADLMGSVADIVTLKRRRAETADGIAQF